MSSPQTINGLMRHLRNDCHINISGSFQKRQLVSYGYYHGYKGYRFVRTNSNRLNFSDFSEVVAVIEYDNNLKAALYSDLMFVETAIKNIVCNESVSGLKNGTFEHIFRERMHDSLMDVKLQSKRLKLRNSIYQKISNRYSDEDGNDNQMVRHFYNRGEDIPIWVVFEIMYLSDLASFFECLSSSMREQILRLLNMYDVAIDTNHTLLSTILYTIKGLRNSVAHNNIIFDTRFKDRNISRILKQWVEKETRINNITLYSLIDYIIIVCCMLKRVDFTNTRAKALVDQYKKENDELMRKVGPTIYSSIIQTNVATKITALETYLSS